MESDYPASYYVFKFLLFAILLYFLGSFLYNSYKITKQWTLIINRNKFFFLFSLYFIIFLSFSILMSSFQSLDTNGVKLLFILAMYNFYIFVLQIMWRVTSRGHKEAQNIFEIKKPVYAENDSFVKDHRDVEVDYFKDSVQVEVISCDNQKEDESFESFRESSDENKTVLSVRFIRNPKGGAVEGKNWQNNLRKNNRWNSKLLHPYHH